MNKSRLIWGIICLALGALIAILTFVLPENRMMFMVGDTNVPIAPAIILGIIGLVLLVTAFSGKKEDTQTDFVVDEEKAALNKRLETIGWGLFLIMLGGFLLVPHTLISKGVWSIGVGAIMLGLNVTRYFYNIKLSGFTTLLGILALLSGIAQLLGWVEAEWVFLLIILGAYLILKPWFDKRQLFGRAEEG